MLQQSLQDCRYLVMFYHIFIDFLNNNNSQCNISINKIVRVDK